MRNSLLALAIASLLPTTALAAGDGAGTYIVEFVEAPLATFAGPSAALDPEQAKFAATSPSVTGARRLDLESPASRAYRTLLEERRSRRLREAEVVLGKVLAPRFSYDVVLNGVSLELDAVEAARLRTLPGVASVRRAEDRRLQTDAGPSWIGAPAFWSDGSGSANRGEGAVIGVIDTGIRSAHPSFAAVASDGYAHVNPRGRFYGRCSPVPARCNAKLIGIYDFTTEGQRDGLDVDGHGTHVAGTAAGNPLAVTIDFGDGVQRQRSIAGVAPRASLISYKACVQDAEEGGTCPGDALLAALNQAVADGVDVINYSIGGDPRDPWQSSDALAMLNARAAGTVVVVAAGNDGPGRGSVTAPGNAPWVLTVAASTHDRGLANRLVDLQGGATPPPFGGVIEGVGLTGGYGPAAIVRDPVHPLCSRGGDLDFPPTGASNPWTSQVFSGELVLCQRGVTARVAKSNNVRLAGGGGTILYNGPADAEGVVADAHSIPSTHVGWQAGQALLQWLASGTGHRGRLEGLQLRSLPAYADLLAAFSGRGPAEAAGDVLKPDITAPGVSILAASHQNNGATLKSGTSMATPHVAGAAALLRARHPGWGPDEIESALQTTARAVIRRSDGSPGAEPVEQGSGLLDLRVAAAAGLYFPIARAEFQAAAPVGGSLLGPDLNRPSLFASRCFEQCSFSRRVAGLRATRWTVAFDLPQGATGISEPASFTLQAGEERALRFDFDLTGVDLPATWVNGAVRLVPEDDTIPTARLPLALFAEAGGAVDRVAVTAAAEAGSVALELDGYVALPEAAFAVTELVEPLVATRQLLQDPTRNDRYDSFGTGIAIERLSFSPGGGPGRIEVEVSSARAPDIDLFVGRDANGDSLPGADEELCASTSPTSSESCVIEVAETDPAAVYWVMLQSWQGSGTLDSVSVRASAVRMGADARQAGIVGPGRAASGESLPLRLHWDLPDLDVGGQRTGYLLVANHPDRLGSMDAVRLDLTRSGNWAAAPRVLAPGVDRRLRLAPGQAQDRYVIEVPPGAAQLRLSSRGAADVHLHLARGSESAAPSIGPAPARPQAAFSATGSEINKTVVGAGALLAPGRWYLTPTNTGTAPVDVDLRAELAFEGARPEPLPGAYYNPARSGAGVYFYTVAAANAWGLVWYTYEADGTPTWYLGVAPAAASGEHVWRVPLDRFTWNGERVQQTAAGEAFLSLQEPDRFVFGWNLLGESGSEPMQLIPQPACAAGPLAVSGFWYSPNRSGFGYSVLVGEGLETYVAYLYDGSGRPRWLLGNVSPFGGSGSLPLRQYSGACPLCAYAAPTFQPVGTLLREYGGGGIERVGVEASFAQPLSGAWSEFEATRAIADVIDCP